MKAQARCDVSTCSLFGESARSKRFLRCFNKPVVLLSTALMLSSFDTTAATHQVSAAPKLTQPQMQQSASAEWVDIAQADLVYLHLEEGVVVLQLASQFAPRHTERFRQLVASGFYDGLSFYRVIDQFVLQAGLPDDEAHPQGQTLGKSVGQTGKWPALQAEFSWPIQPTKDYVLVQTDDIFAKETGFHQGFPVGRDGQQEWLLNCPNMVSMARNEAADSATTEFAIMQGQAPRHLDKNMSMIAKVVWGGEWLNLVKRGNKAEGGMIADFKKRSLIVKARMGNQLKPSEQLHLQVMNANSRTFADKLAAHRQRTSAFFHDKGNGKVDICYQQLPVRLKDAVNN